MASIASVLSSIKEPLSDIDRTADTLIVLGIAVLCAVAYFYSYIRVPAHLRDVPGAGALETLYWLAYKKESIPVFQTMLLKRAKDAGAFRYWMGKHVVYVYQPELVKRILTETTSFKKVPMARTGTKLAEWMGSSLLTMTDDEEWRTQRRLCNPAFHHDYLRLLAGRFGRCCQTMVDVIGEKPGSSVDVHDLMQRLTLDILGTAAFGYDFQAIKSPGSQHTQAYNYIVHHVATPFRMVLGSRFDKYFSCEQQLDYSIKHIDKLLYDVIERRLENLNKTGAHSSSEEEEAGRGRDLLDCMLAGMSNEGTGALLSDKTLRDNMITFFLAGHDTTASALAFVLWHLAHHPTIQERAIAEIDTMVPRDAGDARPPSYEEQASLQYTDRVIKETLRKVPSVFGVLQRHAVQPVALGKFKSTMPCGQQFGVAIYAAHHYEKTWEDPKKFDPDRFDKAGELSTSKRRHPFGYVPFSAGPRNCIGNTFSLVEQRTFLACLLRKYTVHLADDFTGGPDDIKFKQGFLNYPIGMKLVFKPRIKA